MTTTVKTPAREENGADFGILFELRFSDKVAN